MPGGYGRGRRHRWWYRRTGIPGWMRFGDDPGFDQGYDPREYDYLSGEIPPLRSPPFVPPMSQPRWTPEDELKMLEEEEQMLEDELEEIKKRIEGLRKEVK